jgi:hypothetical protein
MIICTNSGILKGGIIIRLDTDFGDMVKVPLKKGEKEKGWVGGGN